MIKKIKSTISRNFTNVQGWRTQRKIIVIETDDWGSIRMPNKEIYTRYKNLGYDIDSSPYCKFDTLANSDDLSALFEVLLLHKNSKGAHPKLTFNTVVANPRFPEIAESGFHNYFYEPFTETLERYYPNENVFSIWLEGIAHSLITPQFHGREHLNVPFWLEQLRMGNKPLAEAYNMGFWGIPRKIYQPSSKLNIQAAFGSSDLHELEFYTKNILEGLQLFEEIFGFKSKTFIANNYTFPEELNTVLYDKGVIGIQGMKKQKLPRKNGGIVTKNIFTGRKNQWQQVYIVRNAMFEPSQMPMTMDNVGSCLRQIGNSFFWKKPAIISSHRLNYIGSIDEENRNRNLVMFNELLKQILKRWPDVEFLSSDELVEDMFNEELKKSTS